MSRDIGPSWRKLLGPLVVVLLAVIIFLGMTRPDDNPVTDPASPSSEVGSGATSTPIETPNNRTPVSGAECSSGDKDADQLFIDRVWRFEAAYLSRDFSTQQDAYADLATADYREANIVTRETVNDVTIKIVDQDAQPPRLVCEASQDANTRHVVTFAAYETYRNGELVNYIADAQPHATTWVFESNEWRVTAETND